VAGGVRVHETADMQVPETRYTRSRDVNIAYQVVGRGPIDLVYVPSGFHHAELVWENPPQARFFGRLAGLSRLLLFDKRGTGMSDRVSGSPTLEARMDDIRAVMDAADSKATVLFGTGDGGQLCMLFAATYPERTKALVLFNSSPRNVRSPDLPWLRTRGELENLIEERARRWTDSPLHFEIQRDMMPSATEEEVRRMVQIARHTFSPGAYAEYMRMNLDVDVRDVLPTIRVPTLVMCRTGLTRTAFLHIARYLTEHIHGARLVELDGSDFPPMFGDQERLFSELEHFLADVGEGRVGGPEPERVLATVLFTDIVDATVRASELGDRRWGELLAAHNDIVRRQLALYRGREMDTAGDGFFATFDGPARAIHCACAIRDSLGELAIEVRAGLHTGECELVEGKATGIAVHVGARIAALAAADEVLVSSTVKDLVAGSEIAFVDRGEHALKGMSRPWRVFAVA
jgi:class 3 adenylate cyclase/pimeloyl-ACP methyl ester carboxylesterase